MIRFKIAALVLLIALSASAYAAGVAPVHVLRVDGQIDPAIAGYIEDGIRDAEDSAAQAVLIAMDTPGGALTAMQEIIKMIFASRVPVIVFVSPNGAAASSAGALITMAADIAAMVPVSNIGAATPVNMLPIGGADEPVGEGDKADEARKQMDKMSKKVENYAADYARSIAEKRGRNVQWAEKAVREAANLTAKEALQQNVIDYVVDDVPTLMKKIDGREIELAIGGKVTLHTAKAPLKEKPMGSWDTFLHYLSNPLVALFLLSAAMYGLIYELSNPGSIFPGVLGGIALILLLYSFSVIPINAAGFAFIALALILFIAEAFTAGIGILAFGGVVSLFFGLMMLFRASEGFMVSIYILGFVAVLTGAFFVFLVGLGVRALRNPYVSSREGVVGHIGEARTDLDPKGKVFIDGSLWSATSETGTIAKGDNVEVTDMNGLKLKVKKAAP